MMSQFANNHTNTPVYPVKLPWVRFHMGEFKLSERCCQPRKPSATADPSRSRKPHIFDLGALPVWIFPPVIALSETRKSLYRRVGCEQLRTGWVGQFSSLHDVWHNRPCTRFAIQRILAGLQGDKLLTILRQECSEKHKICGIITVFTVFLEWNTAVLMCEMQHYSFAFQPVLTRGMAF